MSDQMLLSIPAPTTGVKHVCLPDLSTACGLGALEKPDGDRLLFGAPAVWRDVTCDGCRSLGRAYRNAVAGQMQGRQA